MRDLPAGINKEAKLPDDIYKDVQDDFAREEIKALYICLSHNMTSVAILSVITGLMFDTIVDAASYIYQHTTSVDVVKILIEDMGSFHG